MNAQTGGNTVVSTSDVGRRWPWVLVALLLLLLVVLILLPYGIRYGLQQALLASGAEQAQIDNIDFNPFIGELMVDELQVDVGAERPLVIPRARLEIQWLPLLEKRAVIQGITIEYTRLMIEQDETGAWRIGGLALGDGAPPPELQQAPATGPWEFAVNSLKIRGSEVQVRTPQLDTRVRIKTASLTALESWQQEQAAPLKFEGSIDDSPLELEADIAPFAESPGVKAQIKLADFSLTPFAPLVGPDLQALDGVLTLDIVLEARQGADGLQLKQLGKVVLDRLRLGLEQAELSQEHFAWEGDIDFGMSPEGQLRLQAKGQAVMDGFAASQEAAELGYGRWQWDGTLSFAQEAAGSRLGLDGRIDASDLRLRHQALALSDADLSWEGALGYAPAPVGGSELQADGRLALTGIKATTETMTIHDEKSSWQGQVRLALREGDEPPRLHASGLLESSGLDLEASLDERHFQLRHGGLNWDGWVDFGGAEQAGGIAMEARAGLQGLAVEDITQQLSLLALQRLEAPRIRLQGPDDIQVSGLRLEDVVIARVGEASGEQDAGTLFSATEVSIDPISLGGNVLEIEKISLKDVDSFIRRQSDGSLYLLDRLQALGAAAEAEATEAGARAAPEGEAPPMAVRIGQVVLVDGGTLRFEDEAVTPPFHQTLQLDELQLSQIDTGKPRQAARFTVKGGVGKYSRLSAQGSIVPLASRLTLDMEAKVEAFELNPLSSYTAPVLGYNLAAGTLNADSAIGIDNGLIEGSNKLVINNLTVTPQDEARMQQLNAELSMPLDAALSMLRDSNNDIHLELPVSGDVADPKFALGDVINTALGNAMKAGAMSYLKLALQPYGTIITLAQIAGEAAARVNLDPVSFAVAGSDLDEEARHYLERIAALMKERPQLRIRVCGMAGEADRERLVARAMEAQRQAVSDKGKGRDAPKTAPPPIVIPEAQLLELAKARADRVKDHLVDSHAIDPTRLFICLPALDSESAAAPRVLLQI